MSNRPTAQTERMGNLLVITAPSGAGKSTLVARLRAAVQDIDFSISYTTRPPREGEQNGREYYFVSVEEFERMLARDEFLEWAEVHNNYYGTHRDSVSQSLDAGKDILLDIDVQGAEQVKKLMPQAVLIFILPPSFEELSDRLQLRALDADEVITNRLNSAICEVARYNEFHYVIINDDLDRAAEALIAVARAERLRPARIERRIQSILSSFRIDRKTRED